MIQGYQNLRRLNKIVATLVKYGFGGVVSELHILPYFSFFQRILFFRRAGKGKTVPVRIRLVLEELGPFFIKLGQVASTRADVMPYEWIEEFKKLQDMVPPEPYKNIKSVVENALKGPISEKFASFDETPVASASIAQVHHAVLKDGTEVAVKIKRPKIGPIIDADLSVMLMIAKLLVKYVPSSRRYRPLDVVTEFTNIIHKEQNMSIEAGNFDRFGQMFKGDKRIQIPKVYWNYTTDEMLTMERISGVPMDEVERIEAMGLDIKKIAENGIELFFRQVFEHGTFHADLHPGNIFVRDDGVIIYLDFGIVGRLDRKLRGYLASMLYYLLREDFYGMAMVHKKMGLIGRHVDLNEFEEALRDIAEPLMGKQLEHINCSALLLQLIETARRFEMVLQPNLLLLQKSMVIIEGVGRQLYPDIDVMEVARPLIFKWMAKEKLSPKAIFKDRITDTKEMVETITALPGQAGEFFDMAVNEELKLGFVHHGLETLTEEINRTGKKLAYGLVIGALVVGSSLITAFAPEESTKILGVPLLGGFGYFLSIMACLRSWMIR